jgi:hypothetical protein
VFCVTFLLKILTKWLAESQVRDDVKSEKIEPVETVNASVAIALFVASDAIPLLDKDFKILSDIRLKLENRLGSKSMRNNLSLARVFSSVACVEKTATDRYKGVVKVTILLAPIPIEIKLR